MARNILSAILAVAFLTRSTGAVSRASDGCKLATQVELENTANVTLDDRWYLLYFPKAYQPGAPAPLILSFHGGTRDAEDQQELDSLTTEFFNQEYVVVYPNGIDGKWQGVPGVEVDDIGFTSKILDSLQSQYCIDLDRIFATGKSDGAGFDGVLACDENMSKRIAAFAPVSGAFYTPNAADNTCDPTTTPNNPAITPLLSCTPGRTNIPMLEFHGLADATIAYNGGVRREACLPTIPHWIQTWAQRAGLGAANSSSSVPGALEYSSAVRYEFGQGASQGLVTHIVDGTDVGHDWPSTVPNDDSNRDGDSPATFNASSIIIDFFAAHPLQ